ncbi:MAG: AMP-binding protein [Anaerovoracaceae bacterium]|nr:AMP-binding protein [Anaerovoracaceae bacterium]
MAKSVSYVNSGKTIRELMYNAAGDFPDRPAFRYKVDGVITRETFEQLKSDVEALGTCLFSRGLKDINIGLIGENTFPWFLSFLSVVCGGNTAVPFDKGLTKTELETCVSRSHIKVLFYDSKFNGIIDHIREKHPDITYICMTGEESELEDMMAEGREKIRDGFRDFLDKEVKEEDVAVYLFTSGTTSESKIVMLTHGNISSNIRDMLGMKIFYPEDVNMAFLPFHHSFGLVGVLVFLSSGADNVFCDGLKYVQKNFAEYGVSVFVGVPLLVENLYHKVMKQIEKQGKTKTVNTGLKISAFARKLGIDARRKIFGEIIEKLGGSLRLIISGAAPLAPEVAKGLNDFGIVTIQGYGLTETSPVLSAERPWAIFPGSVGTPMFSVKLRIDDPDENGIGEIVAQGPNIMLGYYNQPEETADVIRDGWFYTGDLGRIDGKGNLWITGRKKNVIVLKNGKNIFPEEIEELINRIPYVSDSMIFTREKHNELVLWVEVRYDEDYMKEMGLDEKGIAEKFADAMADINFILPKYKHVNHFILTSEPMIQTTTMKVKRKAETEKIMANWDEEKEYTVKAK